MTKFDLDNLKREYCRVKTDDKYDWIQCAFCKKDVIADENIFHYDDDQDIGWCSEDCVQAAEERGMQQWESQQEDEGHE